MVTETAGDRYDPCLKTNSPQFTLVINPTAAAGTFDQAHRHLTHCRALLLFGQLYQIILFGKRVTRV